MKELPVLEDFFGDHVVYDFEVLDESFDEVKEVLPDRLWACIDSTDSWIKITFMEWFGTCGEVVAVKYMMDCEGPNSQYLRECRHTNIGDEGYVFYLNREVFEAAFKFLTTYFDLD